MKQLYILLIVIAALAACTGGRRAEMQQRLQALNALNRADSVLTATNRDEAQLLADYFDRHGTSNEQMLAHYLVGRCYADMHEAPMAIHCYQEAIRRADTTAADCDFAQLSRVYGQSAAIFYQQGLYRNSLEYDDLSSEYGWRGNDTLNALLSYANKASVYYQLQLKDSAILIHQDAIEKLKLYNYNKVAAGFAGTLAKLLIDKGETDKAGPYLYEHEKESGYFNENGDIGRGREVYYYFKGLYHLKKHHLDSAEYYFRKELHTGKDFNNQRAGAYGLSQLYQQKNNSDSTAKYALYYSEMNDSAFAQRATHEVEQAKAMYDYSRQQEIAKEEKERADRQSIWLLSVIVCAMAFLIVAGIAGFLLYHQRNKRRSAELQYQEIQAKYRKSLLELADLKANGANTEKLIEEKTKEVACLQAKLANFEFLRKVLSGHTKKEDLALLRENDKYNSLIKKSNAGKIFSSEDWAQVDDILKEVFPEFLLFIKEQKVSMSDYEYHLCLLVRLYIPGKSCAQIMGIGESYVTKLRKQLDLRLFHGKGDGDSKTFDKCIRSVEWLNQEQGTQ